MAADYLRWLIPKYPSSLNSFFLEIVQSLQHSDGDRYFDDIAHHHHLDYSPLASVLLRTWSGDHSSRPISAQLRMAGNQDALSLVVSCCGTCDLSKNVCDSLLYHLRLAISESTHPVQPSLSSSLRVIKATKKTEIMKHERSRHDL